ncbi:MAG: triose-phosphate isomerase [Rhizobacter sp.]
MNPAKLVVGNWKMNGSAALLRAFAGAAARDWPACETVVCVPHPLLPLAHAALAATPLRCGAQDCSGEDGGAYTGDVSARMIGELGGRYVIVGHAERRGGHAETDGQIVAKAQRALAAGVTPIVCIGEKAEERDGEQTALVLRRQLLQLVRVLGRDIASIVVSYEPVWAIGSGDAATPGLIDHALGVVAGILAFHAGPCARSVRLLYGGSVDPRNAGAILSRDAVAGVLVGAAAVVPEDFREICKAAARCSVMPTRDAA